MKNETSSVNRQRSSRLDRVAQENVAKHDDVKNIIPFVPEESSTAVYDALALKIEAAEKARIIPIFVRFNKTENGDLLKGIHWVNYYSVMNLISGGRPQAPLVKAFTLRQQHATRKGGQVLVQYESLMNFFVQWWNQRHETKLPPFPSPRLEPVFPLPGNGEICPFTSLKNTTMAELIKRDGKYGNTKIAFSYDSVVPGARAHKLIHTQSFLDYIWKLPPPTYAERKGGSFDFKANGPK